MHIVYNKTNALKFIKSLGNKARPCFSQFKIWAFQTAFHLRRKRRLESEVICLDCFLEALASTGDTAVDFRDMAQWELIGFYRWYREVKQRHGEHTQQIKAERKAAREAKIMAAVNDGVSKQPTRSF